MNRFVSILILGLLVVGCGEADAEGDDIVPIANETATDVVPAPPAAIVDPQNGGTVVSAGPYPIEVVGRDDTGVEAFFLGGDAPDPGGVELTVTVPTTAGDRPVVLVWDPREARFRGVVPDASLAGGPIEVVVATGGETYRGAGPALIVVQSPAAPRDPAPQVVVERPAPAHPAVVVNRPGVVVNRPAVVVQRPAVVVERPGVVIEGPRHHPRRIGRGPRHHRGRGHRRRRGRRH